MVVNGTLARAAHQSYLPSQRVELNRKVSRCKPEQQQRSRVARECLLEQKQAHRRRSATAEGDRVERPRNVASLAPHTNNTPTRRSKHNQLEKVRTSKWRENDV
jgi:hypothetical protein